MTSSGYTVRRWIDGRIPCHGRSIRDDIWGGNTSNNNGKSNRTMLVKTAANTNRAVLPPRHNNPTPRSIKNVRAMPITTSREKIRRHFVHSPDNPDTEAMVGGRRRKKKTFNSDGVDTTKRITEVMMKRNYELRERGLVDEFIHSTAPWRESVLPRAMRGAQRCV